MFKDFTTFLWLLKLGALLNLYFLANTWLLPSGTTDPHIVVPAQILFAVSAYRCLFPVYYKDNVVFHDSPLSGWTGRVLRASERAEGRVAVLPRGWSRYGIVVLWCGILGSALGALRLFQLTGYLGKLLGRCRCMLGGQAESRRGWT